MGCLNDNEFKHWFGNIHLSGPCNRSCYFCIGQHMMSLDPLNVLATWPLEGIEKFVRECRRRKIKEVYLTGSNTEPLLYQHLGKLVRYLRQEIPGVHLGIRSNGVLAPEKMYEWLLFDEASITVCSTSTEINQQMMGGPPPDLKEIVRLCRDQLMQMTINITLGPENKTDIHYTLDDILNLDYWWKWINLREPYGQPRVGNPLEGWTKAGTIYGMPYYLVDTDLNDPLAATGMRVTYWDVHYVRVKSVNLYANGHISTDYSVSKGHDPVRGEVKEQRFFTHGRQVEQWQYKRYQQLAMNSENLRNFMDLHG